MKLSLWKFTSTMLMKSKCMVSALEEVRILVVDFKLEVLCYAAKGLPLVHGVSKLVIPGLVDQLNRVGKTVLPNLLEQRPQVRETHLL